MKRFSILKTTVATAALALAFGMMATPASAEDINLCHLEGVSQQVIAKIRERADFADLLQQVNKVCPASAVTLTAGATATVEESEPDIGGRDGYGFADRTAATPSATTDEETGGDDGNGQGDGQGYHKHHKHHKHQKHHHHGPGGPGGQHKFER